MLKREITYTDYDGNRHTEIFWFNLSRVELINFELEHEQGLEEHVKKIIATEDNKEAFREMKEVVLSAYGVRNDDSKVFEKSEKLKEQFRNHAAFDELVIQLLSDQNVLETFVNGILPAEQLAAMNIPDKPNIRNVPLPPPPDAS